MNTTQLITTLNCREGQTMHCMRQPTVQMQLKTKPLSSPVVVTHTHKAAEKNGCPDLISEAAWCISSFMPPPANKT